MMSPREQIEALKKELPNFQSSDQRFAISLVDQYRTRGDLSERQWPYVIELLKRRGITTGLPSLEKRRDVVNLGNLSAITKLFDSAKESGIKIPKLRFEVDGEPLILAATGPASRYPGEINVNNGDTWLGRIDKNGTFQHAPSRVAKSEWLAGIVELAHAPMEALQAYGRKTGTCSLCGLTLTNPESIKLGIGPICTGKWGV